MSFPKTAPPGIQLSAEARKDLRDILRYTDATWGERQLFVYRDKIDEALRAIGDNPKLGHHRDDLPQIPCSDRPGKLKRARAGQYSIRINKQ